MVKNFVNVVSERPLCRIQFCSNGQDYRAVGAGGMGGSKIFADQFNLFKPGGLDYANDIFRTSYGPGKDRVDTKCIRGVTALTMSFISIKSQS
jgi:hypothetical protein